MADIMLDIKEDIIEDITVVDIIEDIINLDIIDVDIMAIAMEDNMVIKVTNRDSPNQDLFFKKYK